MKTLLKLSLILLLIGFTNTGCEKIKDLADVTFDADFEAEMDVAVQPTLKSGQAMGTFSEQETIDPNTNEDFKTYASKIKEVKVEKVIVEITQITNAPGSTVQVGSATLSVEKTGYTSAQWVEQNVTLTVGKTFEYSTTSDQFTNLMNIINTKESFDVKFFGTADPVNAGFRVKVYINTKITANALN